MNLFDEEVYMIPVKDWDGTKAKVQKIIEQNIRLEKENKELKKERNKWMVKYCLDVDPFNCHIKEDDI